jgi:hypothetical protein
LGGGRLRLLATIEQPAVARKILSHRGTTDARGSDERCDAIMNSTVAGASADTTSAPAPAMSGWRCGSARIDGDGPEREHHPRDPRDDGPRWS